MNNSSKILLSSHKGSNYSPRQLLVRIMVLAILLAVANAWVVRHLGTKIGAIGIVNGFIAFFGFLFAKLNESEKQESSKEVRRILSAVLDKAVLIPLAIVFAVCGSFVSSITIMASGATDKPDVYVTPEGQPRDESSGKSLKGDLSVVRYVRLITPFGRAFYIEVDGYLRYPIDLYPWKGATIRVTQDLVRAPSILVRIPYKKLSFAEGGKILIHFDETKNKTIKTDLNQAAVLIGRKTQIPKNVIEEWRSELKAANYDDNMTEKIVRAWKKVVIGKDLPPLNPGTVIRAEFVSHKNKSIAEAEFTVTTESFQDISLSVKEN